MFHLLQPIWMLAATGMAIPVAIHLWNVRQGKILKVGSIVFLTQSSKSYATSLKLTELLLLIMRCLLILLLAFFLAKPQFDQSFQNAAKKGWVMMEKENMPGAYNRFKPLIDSLMQAGYEFHYFNAGFKRDNLQEALYAKEGTISVRFFSYRALLKQLDRLVPAELPVYLFTTNYLNNFAGNREASSLNLHWQTYTPADSIATFLSKAYAISTDSIRVILGNSQPSGTLYSPADIGKTKNVNPLLKITSNNSRLFISYQKNHPVAVDTAALTITIFTGKYIMDAAYIKAAVEAVRQFSRHRIILTSVNKPEALPSTQDWLFWLSELPLPPAVKTNNIFRYQEGEIKKTSSWINTDAGINSHAEKIALFKLVASHQVAGSAQQIWQDGFGNTVLSLEATNINIYRLFTHFDPSWNDLPWSSKFPQLFLSLLYPEEKTGIAQNHDKRIISPQQLLPKNKSKDVTRVKPTLLKKDISNFFWLAAFFVFCLERLIALRTKKEAIYG